MSNFTNTTSPVDFIPEPIGFVVFFVVVCVLCIGILILFLFSSVKKESSCYFCLKYFKLKAMLCCCCCKSKKESVENELLEIKEQI